MSATRLLILGVVRLYQPVHGYDVRRELLSWHADEWANVAPGSVYHALKKLAAEDLLAEVAAEPAGNRPAPTRYEITPKGEAEFQELLRRYWWDFRPAIDPFTTAFALMPALPREEAIAALRHRAQGLRGFADSTWIRQVAEFKAADAPHVAEMLELSRQRAILEAEWCDKVADRLAAGDLHASDD